MLVEDIFLSIIGKNGTGGPSTSLSYLLTRSWKGLIPQDRGSRGAVHTFASCVFGISRPLLLPGRSIRMPSLFVLCTIRSLLFVCKAALWVSAGVHRALWRDCWWNIPWKGRAASGMFVCSCGGKGETCFVSVCQPGLLLRTQRKNRTVITGFSINLCTESLTRWMYSSNVHSQTLSLPSFTGTPEILTLPNSLREAWSHAQQILRGLEQRTAVHSSGSGDSTSLSGMVKELSVWPCWQSD